MDIGSKHLGAGFEAGFEGLKPMEIGAKQHDKEGPLFLVLKTQQKAGAQKMGLPSSKL